MTCLGDGWVTLWKGKMTSNDRESKGHFESLGSAMSIDTNFVILEIRVLFPEGQQPHKSKLKTLKNSNKFIDDQFDDVSCSQKSHAPNGRKVLFCFTKKQNDLSQASPNVPHYNLAEVRAPQLIWLVVFVCLDWKKTPTPPRFCINNTSLTDHTSCPGTKPPTSFDATERGKLLPTKSRHRLHQNKILSTGRKLMGATLHLVNWWTKIGKPKNTRVCFLLLKVTFLALWVGLIFSYAVFKGYPNEKSHARGLSGHIEGFT